MVEFSKIYSGYNLLHFLENYMNLTIKKWRDIPTMVMIKKSRREVEKVQLDNRFMEAVDSAASVADATDADSYLTDWNDEIIEIADGDLREPVEKKAAELESAFTQNVLLDYVNNGGYKPQTLTSV